MAKGSFGRTVARAAASGGSRGYRARSPRAWYLLLFVIVAGGIGLIVYSRYERLHPPGATASGVPPRAGDHWYAALAFDVCGTVQPNLVANTNLSSVGIRTFGDGIIDIDPGAATTPADFEGKNATLGTFVAHYRGLVLTASSLGLPSAAATSTTTSSSSTSTSTTSTTAAKATASTAAVTTTTTTQAITKPILKTGARCTSSLGPLHGRGELQVKVWSSPSAKGALLGSNPASLLLRNGQMITVAFVPAGSAIPAPPSRSTLVSDLASAAASTGSPTTTIGPTTSSTSGASSTATTATKK